MPIYKDKKRGTWYYEFAKTINGTNYRKKARGFQTKNEATIAEIDALKKLEADANLDLMLYQCYDEFVSNSKKNLKPCSINKYDQFKRNYLCLLKNVSIYKITQREVSFLKDRICEKGNSESHTNKTLGIFKNFLVYCNVAYDLSAKLQLPLLEPYKCYKVVTNEKKQEFLPPAEFEKILNCFNLTELTDLYYYTIIYVLYWSGLRIGELAALTPSDYASGSITINKDYMRVSGVDYVLAPKTQNSIRSVALDEKTQNVLNNYLEVFKPTKRIFSTSSCEFINQPRLRRVLASCVKCSGLDDKFDIHLHSLRHSHASYLRSLGYDEFVISSRLGNTPKVSASTYIHASPEEMKNLAMSINKNKNDRD